MACLRRGSVVTQGEIDQMSKSQTARLGQAARLFRTALDRCAHSSGYPGLASFPLGGCGDVTLLLGAYFVDTKLGSFDYIHGERRVSSGGAAESHAWLQRADLIVDITADQFRDVVASVIITRDGSWHRLFKTKNRGIADFRIYDEE